ncbi:MAG: glutamyl-tRNA reductase [Desulfovibrio sp.]|uniref:glutamyl-tRNA reductase n=1 Tax=Desulfovibrio sp. 7SRBS1 TaxID=3378064 RepID=UPI003B3CE434
MRQEITLVGLNHKSASVDIRERFALSDKEGLECEIVDDQIHEALVLSTCNRVEIITSGAPGHDASLQILDVWARACNCTPQDLSPHVYIHRGLDAINHIFCVASSLDSMVVGEPQILGQLKDAYRCAVECGTSKVILNRLLHRSFFVAKRIRTETAIASSAVSISYAAVELAKSIFGELNGKNAMLIGAGEMAELAAQNLLNGGIDHILVANRTFSRACELAERFKGTAVRFAEMFETLEKADIIISSTGATSAILSAKDIKHVLRKRRNRPMFFIDIAVPRDIDPDVNSLDNVYLYDIDDLKEVVEENMAQRRDEAQRAQGIIFEETALFVDWLNALALSPTIRDMLCRGEDIAHRELAKTLKRLGPDISDETRDALETLVSSINRKLHHEPIIFLKRRAQEEGASERFIDLARRMFNLDDDTIPENAHSNRKGLQNDCTCPDCGE